MDKNSLLCPWGECPGLDRGPKSREHEGRFAKRDKPEAQMIKNDSAAMTNVKNTQNHAK